MSKKNERGDRRSGARGGLAPALEERLSEFATGDQVMEVVSEVLNGVLDGLVMQYCGVDEMKAQSLVDDAIETTGVVGVSREAIRTVLVQAIQNGKTSALVLPPTRGARLSPLGGEEAGR